MVSGRQGSCSRSRNRKRLAADGNAGERSRRLRRQLQTMRRRRLRSLLLGLAGGAAIIVAVIVVTVIAQVAAGFFSEHRDFGTGTGRFAWNLGAVGARSGAQGDPPPIQAAPGDDVGGARGADKADGAHRADGADDADDADGGDSADRADRADDADYAGAGAAGGGRGGGGGGGGATARRPEAADSGEGSPEGADAGESKGGPVLYVVRAGDTLSAISSRYRVSVSDLWIANRLRNPHSLMPGQSLIIPSGPAEAFGTAATGQAQGAPSAPSGSSASPGPAGSSALPGTAGSSALPGTAGSSALPTPKPAAAAEPTFHRVRAGENLWVIARNYGTTVSALCDTNGISANDVLHPGQRLEVPAEAGRAPASPAEVTLLANWPVQGTITSAFGLRNGKMHEGLDIAAPRGTPILAAAAGRVKSAGLMGNYGRALIIDHGNGISTLYAHCDRLLVTRGQRVAAGQKIALLGSTGRSTGPHLHFEVIVSGRRRDPLDYLWGG